MTPWENICRTAPVMPIGFMRRQAHEHVAHVADGRVADDDLKSRCAMAGDGAVERR